MITGVTRESIILGVLTGVFSLFFIYFILIAIITLIQLAITGSLRVTNKIRIFLGILASAVITIITTYLSIFLISVLVLKIEMSSDLVPAIIFGLFSGSILALSSYFISGRFFKFGNRDKIAYSLLVAIIVNPVWFIVLGFI